MAVIVDVPRIRVDDLVAGGDIRALTDVATVQHSVWGETRMFWLAPTYVVLRDTGGEQDLFRAAVHRPDGYDTARLYMHVTGTGGGTHKVGITIDGDTNIYSVPHATPSEFFVPLVSTSDIQPVLVEVDIDGTGSNDYTVTMCIVLDDVPFPGAPEVITFGDALADVLTYDDLPTTLAEGATARHYTEGSHYRLWKGGAIPIWVPSRVYGVDGSTLALTAYILGDEQSDADLDAHGWPTIAVAGDANVGVVYEGASVLLKCSGAAGLTAPVVGASSVTIVADTATASWSGTTRWWAYSDSVVVSAVSNSHARWVRARDGGATGRNLGVGSNGGGATTYFDWANNLRNGQANQVSFIALAGALASTRREYEFVWEGSANERTEMAMNFAPQGGIARTAMTTDTNALAFTVRAEAANNLRTNLRIFRYYLVTW